MHPRISAASSAAAASVITVAVKQGVDLASAERQRPELTMFWHVLCARRKTDKTKLRLDDNKHQNTSERTINFVTITAVSAGSNRIHSLRNKMWMLTAADVQLCCYFV